MDVLGACQWLESTRLAEFVTQTTWGFAAIAGVHLLALGVSVGTIVWVDVRLLGLTMTTCPVSVVYRRVAPWALTGFAVMFVSGAALFVGHASAAYGNLAFRIKLGGLLVAALNAAAFHLVTTRRLGAWDIDAVPPLGARIAGAVSLVAWTVVLAAGRVMSYTMF